MAAGARITDAVTHYRAGGNFRGAVRLVRAREPERLRWRAAVAALMQDASRMDGRDRMRIEEPIRELVLALDDVILRREVVLDARLHRIDLDRGEVLPRWTVGDLRRLAFLAQTDLALLHRYVPLSDAFDSMIDTAAVVLAGRALSNVYRQRAQRHWAGGADAGLATLELHRERARADVALSQRWSALAKTLIA